MRLQARKSHQKKTVYVTLNTCCFHTFKIIRDCQRKCAISCRPLPHRNSVDKYDKYINKYSRVKSENIIKYDTLYAEWIEHLPNQVL